jgi:hypothetical protein
MVQGVVRLLLTAEALVRFEDILSRISDGQNVAR